MPNSRYTYNVDLDNPTTSHSLAILLVAPGSTVLDIGAADGSVARSLAARSCRVCAIESDADAAAKAQSACEQVVVGDVEDLDLESALEGRRFDVVLLLDVLEHLREPLATLERARDLLAPGGRIIASIPNVTHGAVRLSLMSGAFTYTETGLLDRTHIRFFDRRSAEALFADARLQIVERLRVARGLTETEIPIDLSAVPLQIIQMLEADPEATTYQFVLAGVPSDGKHAPAGASLAEQLQHRTDELQAQGRRLEEYARTLEQHNRDQADAINHLSTHTTALEEELQRVRTELRRLEEYARTLEQHNRDQADAINRLSTHTTAVEEELQRVRTELQPELEARMRELAQGHLELRHLHADLSVKEAFIAELRRQLTEVQETMQRLQVSSRSARTRIVSKVAGSLSRYPRVYGLVRRLARWIGGRRSQDSPVS